VVEESADRQPRVGFYGVDEMSTATILL
jgi:hypothetical protein